METEAERKKTQELNDLKGRIINRIDFKLKEYEGEIGSQMNRKELLGKKVDELRGQKKVIGENIKALSGQLDRTPTRKLSDEELKAKCYLKYKISKLREELSEKVNEYDECVKNLMSTKQKMQGAIRSFNFKNKYKSQVLRNKVKIQ